MLKLAGGLYLLFVSLGVYSQTSPSLSVVLEELSVNWGEDSNSCKGYRKLTASKLLASRIDGTGKDLIIAKLGKPNRIQRFYNGVTNRNYVAYIYDVFRDKCPRMLVAASAIQFVFDEKEMTLVEISEIDYCG